MEIDDVASRSSTVDFARTGTYITAAVRASKVRPQPLPSSARSPTQSLILDLYEADALTLKMT